METIKVTYQGATYIVEDVEPEGTGPGQFLLRRDVPFYRPSFWVDMDECEIQT